MTVHWLFDDLDLLLKMFNIFRGFNGNFGPNLFFFEGWAIFSSLNPRIIYPVSLPVAMDRRKKKYCELDLEILQTFNGKRMENFQKKFHGYSLQFIYTDVVSFIKMENVWNCRAMMCSFYLSISHRGWR